MNRHKRTAIAVILSTTVLGAAASADQLNLQVLVNGATSISAGHSEVVLVTIEGNLSSASGTGLAVWGVNVDADASIFGGGASFDITDSAQFLVSAPAGMANFDRNLGFTNPPGPPSPITGYSGTPNGTVLLQVGGAQNTIGNMNPPAYPIGPVTTGIANSGAVELASGILVTPATGGFEIVISLSACFAAVLNAPAVGPPYSVSTATCTMNSALIFKYLPGPVCNDADTNCDGHVTSVDLGVVQSPANWNQATGAAGNPRADVNDDGLVTSVDLGIIQSPANWNTSTGPCSAIDCP